MQTTRGGARAEAPDLGIIATKPIQIITAMILARQLTPSRATLCIVPTFADAPAVRARLERSPAAFARVTGAPDRLRAILAMARAGHRRLFVDSDVGLKPSLAMRLARATRPGLRFALYEEGVSLFEPREDERPRRLAERLGAASTLGEGALTDEVWTYAPETLRTRLPTKQLRRIVETPAEFIERERGPLAELFWPTHADDVRGWGGASCTLFLPSWYVDPRGLARLRAASDFTLCKPHPHLRGGDAATRDAADQQLPASVPAELVVLELAAAFEQVTVLHDGSSTARYVRAPNVRFVELDALDRAAPDPRSGPALAGAP